MKLFVYGTLKQDYPANPMLADQEFLGKAYTKEKQFRLYDNHGRFPCLTRAVGGEQVYGELYEVSEKCMKHLDYYEGVSSGLYKRDTIIVCNEKQEEVEAIAYVFLGHTGDMPVAGACWPSNDLQYFQLHGKRLKKTEQQNEVDGVELWNTRKDIACSPGLPTEKALQEWAMPRAKQLGAVGSALWADNMFEVRPCKLQRTVKTVQLWDTINDQALSEPFESLGELAAWAVDNIKTFNGSALSQEAWGNLFYTII